MAKHILTTPIQASDLKGIKYTIKTRFNVNAASAPLAINKKIGTNTTDITTKVTNDPAIFIARVGLIKSSANVVVDSGFNKLTLTLPKVIINSMNTI